MSEYPQIWYNVTEGKLAIGQAAIEPLLEEGAEIVPLADLLQSSQLPDIVATYESCNNTGWDQEKLLSYGHWLVNVLRASDEAAILQNSHLDHAGRLRLGPSARTLKKSFGDRLHSFRQALGEPYGISHGLFDDWSETDFINYAASIAEELHRKPTVTDYTALARAGTGPSCHTIYKRFGPLNNLHDLIGYPDIQTWLTEDYVEWGVRVAEANQTIYVTERMISALSMTERGPSFATILAKFESLADFRAMIIKRIEESQQDKLARVSLLESRSTELPKTMADMSNVQRIHYIAKYVVGKNLIPQLDEETLTKYCRFGIGVLTKRLGNINPSIDAAAVERTAIMLDVFDDLWPIRDDLQHLKVNAEQMRLKRTRQSIGRHARHRAQIARPDLFA